MMGVEGAESSTGEVAAVFGVASLQSDLPGVKGRWAGEVCARKALAKTICHVL